MVLGGLPTERLPSRVQSGTRMRHIATELRRWVKNIRDVRYCMCDRFLLRDRQNRGEAQDYESAIDVHGRR